MLLPAGSLQGMLTRKGVSAHLPTSVIGACMNKLGCLGRTSKKGTESKNEEPLMEKGFLCSKCTAALWKLASMSCELFFSPLVSLVPIYTGFLIYQEAGGYLLWRIKTPCCLQNPVISPQFYCLQFGNCPPVLLLEEQVTHQSNTHSILFSGYCQRICCVNDCLQCRCPDANPPLCIMGWQDRAATGVSCPFAQMENALHDLTFNPSLTCWRETEGEDSVCRGKSWATWSDLVADPVLKKRLD